MLAAWYRYKKFRTPNCLLRFKHISANVERRVLQQGHDTKKKLLNLVVLENSLDMLILN